MKDNISKYRMNTTDDIVFIYKTITGWYYNSTPRNDITSSIDYLLYFNHLKRFYNTYYLNRLLDIDYKCNINHMLKYY